MAKGIGNPDWQRRYVTSAVPILGVNFNDAISSTSPISDSNGYQYLMVSTNGATSTSYMHVIVNWYQDAAATVAMGITDWTIPPGIFQVIKVPVISRYYSLEMGPVGGATGHTVNAAVYGTNLDQENLLTQNTAVPFLAATLNVPAAGDGITPITGVYGGAAVWAVTNSGTNKWHADLEYYDWPTQTWVNIWKAFGTDQGQSMIVPVNLPYAPIRVEAINDDTVSHTFFISIVTP